jgi:hypothetical protein
MAPYTEHRDRAQSKIRKQSALPPSPFPPSFTIILLLWYLERDIESRMRMAAPIVVTNPEAVRYLIFQLYTEAVLVLTLVLVVPLVVWDEWRFNREVR